MQQYNSPNGSVYLFVQLPSDEIVIAVSKQPSDILYGVYVPSQPNDNWQLLGLQTELSEEQAAEIVEPTHGDKWVNYNPYGYVPKGWYATKETALESLSSLTQSLNLSGAIAVLKLIP